MMGGMMLDFTVYLDRDLLFNRALRSHWRARHEHMRAAKETAFFKVRSEYNRMGKEGAGWERGPVEVKFAPIVGPGGRMFDADAVAPQAKAILDGIVRAELVPDDSAEWVVETRCCRPVRGKRDEIHVVVARVNA